jgi:hypothetical protein
MICYQDKTFCKGDGCILFDHCHRALTEDVVRGAQDANLPIAQVTDPQEMSCWTDKEPEPATTEDLF